MAVRGIKTCLLFVCVTFSVATFVWMGLLVITSPAHTSSLVASQHNSAPPKDSILERRDKAAIIPPRKSTIPHIIHQTWNSYEIPEELVKWVKTWMLFNPEWEYWLWTPDNVKKLLREKYPKYLSMYENYGFTIFRADAMRYFIMDTFGGFYVDLDMECLKPLDDWTYDHQCILSHETYEHPYLLHDKTSPNVMTTMMASRPGHPFFQACIKALPQAAQIYPMDVMRGTGPWFLDNVYNRYVDTNASKEPRNNITVVHPKFFLPTYDPPGTAKLRKQCKVLRDKLVPHALQVCKDLERRNFTNIPFPESYTNHHWVHIFLQEAEWRNKRDVVSIFDLVPNVKVYGGRH